MSISSSAAIKILSATLIFTTVNIALAATPAKTPTAATSADSPKKVHYKMREFTPDPSIREYRIPLFMLKSHPVVIAHVPGSDEPLYFVVDTAAGVSVIDSGVAKRLNLHSVFESGVSITGAGGKGAASSGIVFAEHLKIGKLDLTMDMISMPMNVVDHDDPSGLSPTPLAGIIGLDVLRAYNTTFDVANGELLLGATMKHQLQCLGGKKKTFTEADLSLPGGILARAVIDTGAAQTIFNWSAAKAMGLQPTDTRLRKRDKGSSGIDGKSTETWLYDLPSMQLGEWKKYASEIRISDLPVFASIGLDEQPAAILGIDFLQRRRFTIEKKTGAFCIEPKERGR